MEVEPTYDNWIRQNNLIWKFYLRFLILIFEELFNKNKDNVLQRKPTYIHNQYVFIHAIYLFLITQTLVTTQENKNIHIIYIPNWVIAYVIIL